MSDTLRPLSRIAGEIMSDSAWKGNSKTFSLPYLEAMSYLSTTADSFVHDSGRSVVTYALSNLTHYRGEKAKALKAELKAHLAAAKAAGHPF